MSYEARSVERIIGENSISVAVVRAQYGGPVIVASAQAMPRGAAYRFHDHVSMDNVEAQVREWLDELPADYCLEVGCADVRASYWRELRARLSRVPCAPSFGEASA